MFAILLTRLLTVALLLTDAAEAEEAKPVFESDLIRVKSPIHVQIENRNPHDDTDVGLLKATIAPRVKMDSNVLTGPVFDVTASLRNWGVIMPQGSQAIFSPAKELLFVRSTADDLELTRTLVTTCCSEEPNWFFTFDLRATVTTEGKETPLLSMKSIGFVSGQRTEVAAEDKLKLNLEVSPVIGPDGNTVDLLIEGSSRIGKKVVRLNNMRKMKLSEPADITLDEVDGTTVKLHIEVHRMANYMGPAALKDETTKAKAIEEIEARLKAAQ